MADDNIDALSKAILSEAQSDAEKNLDEARKRAESIRQNAQQQAETVRKDILDKARAEADRLRSQATATAQLKARTIQLDSREKLLDQVFKTAREELPSVQQWTDYGDIAISLLREGLQRLRANDVVVRADKKTQSFYSHGLLRDLEKEFNVKIQLGDPLDNDTGVIVESADKRLNYDNTLQSRLNRMQNTLRAQVYHLLMGEDL